MIVMRIHGGLGNQMFQYALGCRLAADRGCIFKMDIRSFEKDKLRHFALDCFQIDAPVATADDIHQFGGGLNWHPRLRRLWTRLAGPSKRIIQERRFGFDPTVLGVPGNAYLYGYWQTEKYFLPASAAVRKVFQPRKPLSERSQRLADEMAFPGTLSIHVRRGDYVASAVNEAFHNVCDPAWYKRALAEVSSRTDITRAYVFSDDIEWARSNLDLAVPCEFVPASPRELDFEDMVLMSCCQHHIIANSSFSWWGAWLSDKTPSVVVAPARWFGPVGPTDTQDICPDQWIKVN